MKQVIVVPRNGYVNRLQATASAARVAREFDADFQVCWLPQPAAPAPVDVIFAPDCALNFMPAEPLEELLGISVAQYPRYVNLLPRSDSRSRTVVTLAGHDKGEQALMGDFVDSITAHDPEVVVILAGGRFSTRAPRGVSDWDSPQFRQERAAFYDDVKFSADIESVAHASDSGTYVGLHLRYSDRSHQVPSRKAIEQAVLQTTTRAGASRVFVASDSPKERDHWVIELSARGLEPWVAPTVEFGSTEYAGDKAALIDWRILSRSAASVYFTESSFGYEAAVASGRFDACIGLDPNPLIGLSVRLRSYFSDIARAPKRRGWL